METLEKELREICSLCFEDWQPPSVKRTIKERALEGASEFFFLLGYVFIIYFFILIIKGQENFIPLVVAAIFFVFRILIRDSLQRRIEAKRINKEGLIDKELAEAKLHLTIIDKQHPLNEDEETLIITLANLSVLLPTENRNGMISSILQETRSTRLIKLSLFQSLSRKFQINVPF